MRWWRWWSSKGLTGHCNKKITSRVTRDIVQWTEDTTKCKALHFIYSSTNICSAHTLWYVLGIILQGLEIQPCGPFIYDPGPLGSCSPATPFHDFMRVKSQFILWPSLDKQKQGIIILHHIYPYNPQGYARIKWDNACEHDLYFIKHQTKIRH